MGVLAEKEANYQILWESYPRQQGQARHPFLRLRHLAKCHEVKH